MPHRQVIWFPVCLTEIKRLFVILFINIKCYVNLTNLHNILGLVLELLQCTVALKPDYSLFKSRSTFLFSNKFWNGLIDWDKMIDNKTISRSDLKLFVTLDSVDDAFAYLIKNMQK